MTAAAAIRLERAIERAEKTLLSQRRRLRTIEAGGFGCGTAANAREQVEWWESERQRLEARLAELLDDPE